MIKSAPDGYAEHRSNNPVIYPSVYKSVPFDPIADITPIAVIGSTPIVIVVNPTKSREGREGAGGAPQGEAGCVQLRLVRQWHDPAPRRGNVLRRSRCQRDACSVQGCRADAHRSDRWSGRHRGIVAALGSAASEERHAASDRSRHGETPGRRTGDSDDDRAGTAGLSGRGLVRGDRSARLPPADVARINAAFVAAFATPEVTEIMAKQGNTINVEHARTPAAQFFRTEMTNTQSSSRRRVSNCSDGSERTGGRPGPKGASVSDRGGRHSTSENLNASKRPRGQAFWPISKFAMFSSARTIPEWSHALPSWAAQALKSSWQVAVFGRLTPIFRAAVSARFRSF